MLSLGLLCLFKKTPPCVSNRQEIFCAVDRYAVRFVCSLDFVGPALKQFLDCRPALQNWHDAAGFSVLCLSVLLLWVIAQRFRKRVEFRGLNGVALKPFTTPVIAGFGSWILFFVLGTEIWYRHSEANLSGVRFLSIQWPADVSDISKFSISESARRILLYDDAKCASWVDRSGVRWSFYSLIWNSGRTSTQSARIHRPENCLQGSGAILRSSLDNTEVGIGGTPLVFQTYLFERNGLPLYVFYLIWEEGNRDLDRATVLQDWSGISRLQRCGQVKEILASRALKSFCPAPRATNKQERRCKRSSAKLCKSARTGCDTGAPIEFGGLTERLAPMQILRKILLEVDEPFWDDNRIVWLNYGILVRLPLFDHQL